MDELLNDSLSEAGELLDGAADALVQWERSPDDRAHIDAVFRLFHTIKGSSGFLELPRTTALMHAAEDMLDRVRRGDSRCSAGLINAPHWRRWTGWCCCVTR